MNYLKQTIGLVALVALLCAGSPSAAAEPDATVRLNSTSVAAGIGVEWGDGKLILKDGEIYDFSVEGLSVLDLGISEVEATGEIYDLTDVASFPGTYVEGKVGAAVGGGPQGMILENQNGVKMVLESTQVGIKLSVAAEGLQVEMK